MATLATDVLISRIPVDGLAIDLRIERTKSGELVASFVETVYEIDGIEPDVPVWICQDPLTATEGIRE